MKKNALITLLAAFVLATGVTFASGNGNSFGLQLNSINKHIAGLARTNKAQTARIVQLENRALVPGPQGQSGISYHPAPYGTSNTPDTNHPAEPGGDGFAFARCANNDVATGGGFSGVPNGVEITGSYGGSDRGGHGGDNVTNHWEVYFHNNTDSTQTVNALVICLHVQ